MLSAFAGGQKDASAPVHFLPAKYREGGLLDNNFHSSAGHERNFVPTSSSPVACFLLSAFAGGQKDASAPVHFLVAKYREGGLLDNNFHAI